MLSSHVYALTLTSANDKQRLLGLEKIEDKIIELGGKPAFPTNLMINEI